MYTCKPGSWSVFYNNILAQTTEMHVFKVLEFYLEYVLFRSLS